jgi:cell fate (sporulation/competence/biofilm development) regulator YmcA (YheA/YmcA/DUF963 family)
VKSVTEFIEMINNDERINRYKKLEAIIVKDKKLKAMINKLKAVQKQMINAEHIGKTQAHLQFKIAYENQLEAIHEHPLLSEYLALQGDINYMIQEVLGIIEDGVNQDIEN